MKTDMHGFPEDFVCEWCGKDVMSLKHINDDLDYINIQGPGEPQLLQLCRSCFITAYQGLMFAKEVVQDCPTIGKTAGRRIYVAVEQVSQQNELVNVLNWPNHPLQEHVQSVSKSSVTYRTSDSLGSIVQLNASTNSTEDQSGLDDD